MSGVMQSIDFGVSGSFAWRLPSRSIPPIALPQRLGFLSIVRGVILDGPRKTFSQNCADVDVFNSIEERVGLLVRVRVGVEKKIGDPVPSRIGSLMARLTNRAEASATGMWKLSPFRARSNASHPLAHLEQA